MKITLFTSNKLRHNYLINLLSKSCENLFVVQESKYLKKNLVNNKTTAIFKKYYDNVEKAEKDYFDGYDDIKKNNIKIKSILAGDLNKHSISSLSDFLQSDIYIVFGSSYIKGDLINFLIKQKTFNIHMGVSPYYRGSDCNFWALYDGNPNMVGATIHKLTKGLDNGPILYHALSDIKKNPFDYTMSTVKSAFVSLAERITNKEIFKIKTELQDKTKELRYSRAVDFNDEIINNYFNKTLDLNAKKLNLSLYKDPYILR